MSIVTVISASPWRPAVSRLPHEEGLAARVNRDPEGEVAVAVADVSRRGIARTTDIG
jgi:hypothetical protein